MGGIGVFDGVDSSRLGRLLGVLLDVGGEGSGVATTLVGKAVLVTLGEELEGGEATDAEALGDGLVGGGVEVGDDGVRTDLGGKLVPGGGHADAVTAPGGVELDEDVLGSVEDDLVEVVGVEVDNLGGGGHDGEDGEGHDSDLAEHCRDFAIDLSCKRERRDLGKNIKPFHV